MRRREQSRSLRALCALLLALLGVAGPGALVHSNAAPSQAEVEAAENRLMELEREFELVVEEYNATHEELEDLRADISAAELVVDRLERRMAGRQDDADALAEELYKSGPVGGMETVLSAETLAELDARLAYIETSEEANAEAFEELAANRSVLEDELEELEEDRVEAAEKEARLVGLRSEIEDKVAAQEDEIAELNAAIERAERREAVREAAAEEAAERAAAEAAAEAADAAAEEAAEAAAPDGGGSAPPAPISPPAPSAGAQAAVDAALSQVGKPYQWGAAGPDSYDCSGLTMWAWAHAGVSLPHNSQMQYDATPRVAQGDWQPGDLLFYGSPIHHVAMYIGGGRMVEAPYTGSQVRVVSAYRSDYVGAGRP